MSTNTHQSVCHALAKPDLDGRAGEAGTASMVGVASDASALGYAPIRRSKFSFDS